MPLPRRPSFYIDDNVDLGEHWATAVTLIDDGAPAATDTGLLDQHGNPILRHRPTVKFGFVP